MRTVLLGLAVLTALFAQAAGKLGIFESETDVGNPALSGSLTFDPATAEYRITAGGENMWAKRDEFHYVWRRLSGDVTLTATLRFIGQGAVAHRKAGLVIRTGLEPGDAYADAIVHGNGLTGLQWRETNGDITRTVHFPIEAPSRIRLEKHGNVVSMWAAKAGEPLRELGGIQINLGKPVYAGLAVCSHKPDVRETVVFSEVSVETPAGK